MRNMLEMPFFVCLVAWLVVWQDHPVDDMQQNHRCVATLSFGVVKNVNDELIFFRECSDFLTKACHSNQIQFFFI